METEVQFAPGQSRTLAWTKATPAWNGAPLALAANRYDSCCGLPVQLNALLWTPWATRSPAAWVTVESKRPLSPAPQVAVNATRTAAPLATSVAELTLIAGTPAALAEVRAAETEASGEAVAAVAAIGMSAAAQATEAARTARRLGVSAGKCMMIPLSGVCPYKPLGAGSVTDRRTLPRSSSAHQTRPL